MLVGLFASIPVEMWALWLVIVDANKYFSGTHHKKPKFDAFWIVGRSWDSPDREFRDTHSRCSVVQDDSFFVKQLRGLHSYGYTTIARKSPLDLTSEKSRASHRPNAGLPARGAAICDARFTFRACEQWAAAIGQAVTAWFADVKA